MPPLVADDEVSAPVELDGDTLLLSDGGTRLLNHAPDFFKNCVL